MLLFGVQVQSPVGADPGRLVTRIKAAVALTRGQCCEFDVTRAGGATTDIPGDPGSALYLAGLPTAEGRRGGRPHAIVLQDLAQGEVGWGLVYGWDQFLVSKTDISILAGDGLTPKSDGTMTGDTLLGDRIKALATTRANMPGTGVMGYGLFCGLRGFTTILTGNGGGGGGGGGIDPEIPDDAACNYLVPQSQQCTLSDIAFCPETYDDGGTPRDLNGCCRRGFGVQCLSVSWQCIGYSIFCCYAFAGVDYDAIPGQYIINDPIENCADEYDSGAGTDPAGCASTTGQADGWDAGSVACFVLTPA